MALKDTYIGKHWGDLLFCLFLIAGGFLAILYSGVDDGIALWQGGVKVPASVLKMEIEHRETTTRSSVGFTHHHVLVRYSELGYPEKVHDVWLDVPGAQYKELQGMERPQMEVVYDPQKPGEQTRWEGVWSILTVFFGLGLILFGYWVIRRTWMDHTHPAPEGQPPPPWRVGKFGQWLDDTIDKSSEWVRKNIGGPGSDKD